MADSRATECLDFHARLITARQSFEEIWQEIDDRISPTRQEFGNKSSPKSSKGKPNQEKVFDATPGLALDRFKAAMHSLVTPRAQVWANIKPVDEALAEDIEVKRYTDEVNKRLFAARYAANFDSEIQGCYYTSGKFGSMSMFVGENVGKGLFYRAIPMKQLYFAENQYGVIDLVHRDWFWTARQAVMMWGNKTPSRVKDAYDKGRGDQEFRFLHVVKPRANANVSRRNYEGMEFVSYFILYETRELIEEGGFRTFPYPTARYDLVPGEVYGRSPCMTILPDVKMLNVMMRDTVQAAQLKALPPMIAARDGIGGGAIRMTPAAFNPGWVDDQGRPKAMPLEIGGDLGLSAELIDQKRQVVNDALLNTLFQILVDKPNITATEAMLRAQEKGQLVGPTGSRIEAEFLTPMIHREIDILAAADQLPEMPDKLLDAGGLYAIEFDSPLSRARRAEEGVAILRSFEQLAPIAAAMGPEAGKQVFKRVNLDEAVKTIFDVNGAPAKILYSDEEMEQMDEQEANAAEAQSLLAAAPVIADTAKNLTQAQALAASVPAGPAPAVV